MKKCLVITGGVYSGLGKGILTAGLASLIRHKKFQFLKVDPYLNYDAGKLNPNEHGEVYVLKDGYECDMDLGYYEKFTLTELDASSNVTGGQINLLWAKHGNQIYSRTLRLLDAIDVLLKSIYRKDTEVLLIELGGTIDDDESHWFHHFYKLLHKYYNVLHVHLVPIITDAGGNVKSLPLQRSLRTLHGMGMSCDLLAIRFDRNHDLTFRKSTMRYIGTKLEANNSRLVDIPYFDYVYEIGNYLMRELGDWLRNYDYDVREPSHLPHLKNVKFELLSPLILINKYVHIRNTYWHLEDSLRMAANRCGLGYKELPIEYYYPSSIPELFRTISRCSGVILPGGFGERGWLVYRLIAVLCVKYDKPILGICWGYQAITCSLMSLNGIRGAGSAEFGDGTTFEKDQLRLGALRMYDNDDRSVVVRFRHRFHLSKDANSKLNELVSCKLRDESGIMQAYEYGRKVFACQFHPEFYQNVGRGDLPLSSYSILDAFLGSIDSERLDED